MTRTNHVSASSIACFKACPKRYYFSCVEGLRPVEDTEAQRIGTTWHKLLEISTMEPGSVCPTCGPLQTPDPACVLCEGTSFLPAEIMDAVVRHLNNAYTDRPVSIDPIDWEVERIILLYSLVGWQWYYSENRTETIEREIKFELPLRNPVSGRALPRVKRVGKIDRIIQRGGQHLIGEYKSTSKPIDSDSSFWNHLNLSTQISMYALAVKEMDLPYEVSETLYDVWHKPGIRPKKLTQAESKVFVGAGEYCGQHFQVVSQSDIGTVVVDGANAEVEPGKKEGTFAIRETPEMFGVRLLQDIQERPEYYFARRPIPRTDADLRQFEIELYHIYRTIRQMAKDNAWFINESQCEATFKCPYQKLCYHNVDISGGQTPEGFRRIFDAEN